MFALKNPKSSLLLCIGFVALLCGCDNPPPPTPLPDLHFPVVVLFSTSSVVTFKDADDLGVMYINSVITPGDLPALIDSTFAIYAVNNLRSTHSDLWLMAHPSGATTVSFQLEPASKSGIEAARELFRANLDRQTWRDDLEQKRRALAKEKTLPGMVQLVKGASE